jgi:predicted transcriptional regulator of viral defense system
MADEYPSRTLGKRESRLLSTLSADGRTVFTVDDACAAVDFGHTAVLKVLHRLHNKGWIRRLQRGKYLIIPLAAGPEAQWAEHEYLIAASLVSPYYLAYATALHYYGYSERPLNPLIIATTRRKRPVTVGDLTCRFVTLPAHKFFGYAPISLLDNTVQMAEREKAIADGFDRPNLVGGVLEAAKGLWFGSQELDWGKLVATVLRLQNQVAARRLGFWLELLALGDERSLSRLDGGGGHSYARLEPSETDDGPRNAHWRLIVNIPERQLLEWREH